MGKKARTIRTRFGVFRISDGDVLTFPRGVPGFEHCRQFVLLSHETFAPIRCLHAIDGAATFFAVDPRQILPDYPQTLRPEELGRIKAAAETPLVWLALLTFGEGEPTANLRAPIVINPASMLGCQVIVEDERYAVRYRFVA